MASWSSRPHPVLHSSSSLVDKVEFLLYTTSSLPLRYCSLLFWNFVVELLLSSVILEPKSSIERLRNSRLRYAYSPQ
jgi:hypothetical protein